MTPAATRAPLTPMLSPLGRDMSNLSINPIARANQRAATICCAVMSLDSELRNCMQLTYRPRLRGPS
jgi:hypothetical protein